MRKRVEKEDKEEKKEKTKSKEISTQKKDAKNRKIRASYRGHKASTGAFWGNVCKATIALLVQAAKINNISFQPHFPFFLDSCTSQVNMAHVSNNKKCGNSVMPGRGTIAIHDERG